MKKNKIKITLTVLLFVIGLMGYSQVVGELQPDGSRTVTFTNPEALKVVATDLVPVSCKGGSNGEASLTVTGGTGVYSTSWDGGGYVSGTEKTGLSAGQHAYTIKDGTNTNCTLAGIVNIPQPAAVLSVAVTKTDVKCFGESTGVIELTATGGNGGYNYDWLFPSKSGLTAGTYTYNVKDSKNCAVTSSVSIAQPAAALSVTCPPASITNVKCFGEATGAINLTVFGGAGGYSVSLDGGVTFPYGTIITGLSAGAYTCKVKDKNGCIESILVEVLQPAAGLIVTNSKTDVSCFGGTSGAITLSISQGTPNYAVLWNDGITTVNRTNLPKGTYNYTVTDAKGCSISGPVNIAQPTVLAVKETISNVKCYGDSSGSIALSISGGTAAYSVLWNNGLTTQNRTNLLVGNYSYTVSDTKGCKQSGVITIAQPTALTLSHTKTNVTCNGSSNGAINLNVTGGKIPYTFLWNDSVKTEDRNSIPASSYSITVTDANSCSKNITGIVINAPAAIAIPIPTITNVTIYNQNTGAISLNTPTGGTGGYTYKWTYNLDPLFNKSTKDISGLKAGFYTLKVTDGNTCTASKIFEVGQPDELLVTLKETKKITCFGYNNGEITAVVSGGKPNYTYKWYKNGNSITETTNVLKNIGFGIYKVTVIDSQGATKTADVFDIKQPTKLSVSLTNQTNVLCHGAQTGAIDITINGGTAPYTQQWTKGGVNYSTNKNLINLGAGTYHVIITDAVGYNCTASLPVPAAITQPSAPLQIASFIKTDLTGFQTNNGSIAVTVAGGTPTYKYEWRKDTNPTVIGTTPSLSNLSIGTYHLIVKDANNCMLPQVDYSITQPDKLQIVSLTQTPNTNINCHGDSPAEFTATVTGGVKEYTFEWLNTTTGIKYSSAETITATSTTSKASNLGAGTYKVSVKDKNNNILFGTNTFTITQPNKLAFTYTQKNVSCFGDNSGSVKLAISGGILPYTIICGSGTIDKTNATVSGLTKGTYNLLVADANNCQTQQTIVITEPQNSLYIASQISTPTTGFGLSTGKIDITVAGGTAGYIYEWRDNTAAIVGANNPTLNNVPAGVYSILVTDVNGCTTSNSYAVQQPTEPILSETHLQAKCNGLFGSLEAIANGGALFAQNQSDRIYTYKLKNKTSGVITSITGNTASFSNIADGEYSLTATDFGGINSNSIDILFEQPTAITLTPSQTNVKCFSKNDGTATVIANGGIPPYTYIWKEGTTIIGTNSPVIANLQQGNYSVEVRDNNYDDTDISHCVASASFSINQPAAPLSFISDTKTDVTGFNLNNGTITVNITGGTPDYIYTWYFNNTKLTDKTTNAITNLAPGAYKVVITDANLVCDIEKTFVITEPLQLETIITTTPIKCFGDKNGSLQITTSGGVPDKDGFYTYQLFDSNKNLLETQLTANAVFDSRIAGNYYIQVTDANNNQTPPDLNLANPIILTQPAKALTITEKSITNATCPKEADGTITIEVTGGTTDYTYAWINEDKNTNAGNSPSITGLIAGKYKVTVTDKNSCTQTASFIVTEPEDFGFDKEKFTLTKPTANNPNWSVNIVMKGGQNNYNYIVKSGDGSEVLNKTIAGKSLLVENLPKDKYTINVTDNTGCTKTETIDLFGNVLTVNLSQTKSIICNGDGANFDAIATGGTGVINYTWFKNNIEIPAEKGASIKDYGPGTYKVFVIDTDKIELESNSITITQPEQVVISSSLATRPSCFGVKDGIANLTASGGNGKYQYSYESSKWFDFSNVGNTVITGLLSGVYTFYVKDTNGCNALTSQEVIIPETPLLKIIDITITPATGFGLANGSVAMTPAGGNGNYKYNWFKNDGTSINQTANAAINLPAGKYYATITDAKGCNLTSEIFEITEPEKLIATINPSTAAISCFADKSVQLNATVTGGASGNTYEWFNENNQKIGTNLNSPMLGAGSYYVIVTDKNQNKATSNTITINEPALIVLNHSYQDVKCYGESNGAVTLNATGGSMAFSYHYKDLASNYGDWIPFTNASSTICSGLKVGTYIFQIKDKNGNLCSNVPNIKVTISQPNAALSIIDSKTISIPATGKGLSNGSISITPQGGNGNYVYNWFKEDNTNINQVTNTAVNLAAGKYYAIITDAKGCSLASPLFQVTEPPLLECSITVQNVISCNGDKNGSIKPTVIGGFLKSGMNYTYQWYEDGKTAVLATGNVLNAIGKGSYYVIVTDSNGNQAKSKSLIVNEPFALNNTLTSDYTLCGDANDWTITATPSGGTMPYNYIWNTGGKTANLQNVPPAKYSVLVTDNHGCSVTKTITITVPTHLSATEIITKPTCFGGSDATIVLTSSGGQGPYSYLWNTGEKSNILSNASAKGYSVAVTDFKGCVINKSYTIENPPKDVINLGEDVTLCFDQSLIINSTIADDKAKYSWTSTKGFTSNKPIITVSEPAEYTLVVTNHLGCNATDMLKISKQDTAISAEFAVSSQVFLNEKFIIVDISNPIADSVEWVLPTEATVVSKNKDFAELSFSKAGEYELTLNTKKGNCTATQTKKIVVVEGEYVNPDNTDLKKKFDLRIYPNPSNGIFTVDVTLDKIMPAHVKVYNLSNNLIIDSKYEEGKDTYKFNFSLSGLVPGVYFVLVESQQGNQLRKIIIN